VRAMERGGGGTTVAPAGGLALAVVTAPRVEVRVCWGGGVAMAMTPTEPAGHRNFRGRRGTSGGRWCGGAVRAPP
jgi:hypothetical protein